MIERPLLLCYDGSEDAKHAIREAAAMFGPRRALVLAIWQDAAALPPMAWRTPSVRSRSSGAHDVRTDAAAYLPPGAPARLRARAASYERRARRLGSVGAAFTLACGDVDAA